MFAWIVIHPVEIVHWGGNNNNLQRTAEGVKLPTGFEILKFLAYQPTPDRGVFGVPCELRSLAGSGTHGSGDLRRVDVRM